MSDDKKDVQIEAKMSFALYDKEGRLKLQSGDSRLDVILRKVKYRIRLKKE